jgi:negative regulator of sigma E activity
MNNEELDSQLSAMFDNELPAAECELLARRLSRDEELKARWGRYATIGATIRAEGGPRLSAELARRVSRAIYNEPSSAADPRPVRTPAVSRWRTPAAGLAVAASVAAAAILWVRFQSSPQDNTLVARDAAPSIPVLQGAADPVSTSNQPDSYVVPKVSARRSIVPSTQLANYVVAHSEFSSPVNRRNLLSTFIASEAGPAGAPAGSDDPTEDADDDAKTPR